MPTEITLFHEAIKDLPEGAKINILDALERDESLSFTLFKAGLTAAPKTVPEEWRSMVATLASIVQLQNGNLHEDINVILNDASKLLNP